MTASTLYARTNQRPDTTLVTVGRTVFGGPDIPMIAGPCSVESYEQLVTVARFLRNLGVNCLRGGAFKPRSSPYSFQGLGEEGLMLLGQVRREMGVAIITEVMSIEQIELAEPHTDCFQVGSRNMQNFELLRALGRQEKPVLLKRGFSATIEELLNAAEYILLGGNNNVILCERGIRGFDPSTRNVLDLGAVAVLKQRTHLPVIVDPSHGTGQRSLVAPLAKAAVAVGADGIIIEAHPTPEESVSDAAQAISLQELENLALQLVPVAFSVGRSLLLEPAGYSQPV